MVKSFIYFFTPDAQTFVDIALNYCQYTDQNDNYCKLIFCYNVPFILVLPNIWQHLVENIGVH